MPLNIPLLAVFATIGLLIVPAVGQDIEEAWRNTVVVSGEGKVSAAPDVAEVSLGVVSEAPTAGAALQSNNQAMSALRGILDQRGVAAKDIQTSNLSVQPRYNQPAPRQNQQGEFIPRIIGYSVNNTVTVTARDLSKLGELLDAVVSAGANQVHGISFRIGDPKTQLEEARRRAMQDARRKAEVLAGEADLQVGPAIRITELGGGAPPPRPMMRGMAMMAAESVPIAPGETELAVSVQVVYGLSRPE